MKRRSIVAAMIVVIAVAVASFGYVMNRPQSLAAAIVSCVGPDHLIVWRSDCYGAIAKRLLASGSVQRALSELSLVQDEPGVRPSCHVITHFIGTYAYTQAKGLPGAFLMCASHDACGDGCYHGAVEEYISEKGQGGNTIISACDRNAILDDATYLACEHGIGHGLMLLENNDIMKALPGCDALPGPTERTECYQGVFMENAFDFSNVDHPTRFLKADDPDYPCMDVAAKYRNACYDAQGTFVLGLSKNNFNAVADFCAAAPSPNRAACYGSMGGNAVVSFGNPRDIVGVCGLTPAGADRHACLAQALKYRAQQAAGDPETLMAICALTSSSDHADCMRSLGHAIWTWFPDEVPAKCAVVNAKGTSDYDACVAGAGER